MDTFLVSRCVRRSFKLIMWILMMMRILMIRIELINIKIKLNQGILVILTNFAKLLQIAIDEQ